MSKEIRPLEAGLRARCPRCGQGPLFEGFLTVRQRCGVCGLDLAAQDSGDGPAAFIILIVGVIIVGGALFVELAYSPPLYVHLIFWLPLAAFLTLGLLRPFKATLIALQYRHRRHTLDGDR